jgi:fructose PTS system EIIBC or EIIC component
MLMLVSWLTLKPISPLLALALLLVVGAVCGNIARRLKAPSITGQIVGGVLIGQSGLHLIQHNSLASLHYLTEFALGLIAVTVGAHLNVKRLRNAGRRLFLLLLAEAIITPFMIFAGFYWLAKQPFHSSLLWSTIGVATAPATIIALVRETKARGIFVKTLIASVALNNLACIFLFEVARSLAVPNASIDPQRLLLYGTKVLGALLLGTILALLLGAMSRWMVNPTQRMTAAAIALLGAVGMADSFGFSPMLTALCMGMVQTNYTPAKTQQISSVFESIEPLVLIAFFTIAGSHLSFENMSLVGILSLLFFATRFVGKWLAARVAMKFARAPNNVQSNLGLALIPQAGVAIGLVVQLQEDPAYKLTADLMASVVLVAVAMNELSGPILTRRALIRSGDAGKDRSRLFDFLQEEHIHVDFQATTMEDAIVRLTASLIESHHMKPEQSQELTESLLTSEADISSCIGGGLAIPHTDLKGESTLIGVMALNRDGLPWSTPDGEPVHCIILLAIPAEQRPRHLEIIASLARHIGSGSDLQTDLYQAKSPAHAYEILHGEQAMDFNYFLEASTDSVR